MTLPKCADVSEMLAEGLGKSKSDQRKYIDADYQQELLTIMATQVLLNVLTPIRYNEIFSLMLDEWTDISNKEQLSICVPLTMTLMFSKTSWDFMRSQI